MKFFIIHGSYGNPNENWFPWLKLKLEERGQIVHIPKFPTPINQNLNNWMEVFNEYFNKIDEETIFIGHSLGPSFILSILEQITVKVKACFFIAGFLGNINNSEFDRINKTFTTKEFDWEKIKNNCNKFYIYHSNNDPYVPLEKSKDLGNKLDVDIKLIEGAGHFNSEAGYDKFELLLQDINEI